MHAGLKLLFWLGCLAAPYHAFAQDEPATGLIFTPRQQYDSIPLASNPYAGSELPTSVDLSTYMPPPGDQGDQQSCVAWALAYAVKSYHEQRENRWDLTDQRGEPVPAHVFSPSYIYNQINNGMNVGTLFHTGLNALAEHGAALWADMPYTRYDAPIPSVARQNARRFRIDTWRRVNPQALREVKAQLNAGFPVIIGASVDDGFKALMGPESTWERASGRDLGGHAMVIVGYDDARQAFRLINSWGRSWGDGGYAWVTYGHFTSVVGEAYVAQDAKNAEAPAPQPVADDQTADADDVSPPEIRAEQASLTVQTFNHNQIMPGIGPGMVIGGTVVVPAGVQGNARVVVSFGFQNGVKVLALNPTFALPDGQAATASLIMRFNGAREVLSWQAFMPYCVLGVPKGQMCQPFPTAQLQRSYLVAKPTLYVNEFGAAEGSPMPFYVNM